MVFCFFCLGIKTIKLIVALHGKPIKRMFQKQKIIMNCHVERSRNICKLKRQILRRAQNDGKYLLFRSLSSEISFDI